MKPRIIGIAGASGSGKTTVATQLQKYFTAANCLIIPIDNYYKDQSRLSESERHKTNYDHPDSIDFKLLSLHLKALLDGETITMPCYDFKLNNRSSETVIVEPKPIIILEGILVLHNPELAALLDLKIFVKSDLYKSFQRRKQRDVLERGRTPDHVDKQFLSTVWPMYDAFVETSKDKADIVLKNVAKDVRFDMAPLIDEIIKRFNVQCAQKKSPGLFQREKITLSSLTSTLDADHDKVVQFKSSTIWK